MRAANVVVNSSQWAINAAPVARFETDLYPASVDGLIMHLHDENLNGFMKTKGDLRGLSLPVRRQIGAQMAVFIYD